MRNGGEPEPQIIVVSEEKKTTVLLVEDSEDDAYLFNWRFEQSEVSCAIEHVLDGSAAIDFVYDANGNLLESVQAFDRNVRDDATGTIAATTSKIRELCEYDVLDRVVLRTIAGDERRIAIVRQGTFNQSPSACRASFPRYTRSRCTTSLRHTAAACPGCGRPRRW